MYYLGAETCLDMVLRALARLVDIANVFCFCLHQFLFIILFAYGGVALETDRFVNVLHR